MGSSPAGETYAFGGWTATGNPLIVEAYSGTGAGWIGLDAQHGCVGLEEIPSAVRAAEIAGLRAFVRTPDEQASFIGKALDCGADGVIVPMIESAESARQVVAACRFAPSGVRSWGPLRHRLVLGRTEPSDVESAASCWVQIETRRAVQDVDAIAAVNGLDGLFAGPHDLAISMGFGPADAFTQPDVLAALSTIADAARRHDRVAAGYAPHVPGGMALVDLGFTHVAVGSELALIAGQAKANFQLMLAHAGT